MKVVKLIVNDEVKNLQNELKRLKCRYLEQEEVIRKLKVKAKKRSDNTKAVESILDEKLSHFKEETEKALETKLQNMTKSFTQIMTAASQESYAGIVKKTADEHCKVVRNVVRDEREKEQKENQEKTEEYATSLSIEYRNQTQ